MNYRNAHKKIAEVAFGDTVETLWVTLKASTVKGPNYDPNRQTGFTTTNSSPEPIDAHVRQIAGNSLIAREIGLTQSGAIEIVVDESSVNFFRICEKVLYDCNYYTPFSKALGNKIQIYKAEFGFSRIVLFKI